MNVCVECREKGVLLHCCHKCANIICIHKVGGAEPGLGVKPPELCFVICEPCYDKGIKEEP